MRTVWKYPLDWNSAPQSCLIPYDSGSVHGPHVAMQHDTICVWAEVDTDAPEGEYTFYVRGTGHEVPDGVDYLGSCMTPDQNFVWHVFVKGPS